MTQEGNCFILNTNSKKIHDAQRADGRCRLDLMKPECKVPFDRIEDALAWPNAQHPLAKKRRFCFGNN